MFENTLDINVTKRDGTKIPLDLEKIHRVVIDACENISGVSPSEVEMKSQIQFYPDIPTTEIHDTLVKSATELTLENVNYAKVASRLKLFNLRKEVFGQFQPLPLYEIVKRNIKFGVYDSNLLTEYNRDEINDMCSWIRHERDDEYLIAGMEQLHGKYLIKNRVTEKFYETPQIMYMMLSASAFMYEDKDVRMKHVRKFYNIISTMKLSIATPILAGLRSPTRQFSSCVLVDSSDSLDSITAMATANVKYVSKRAGLGNNIGSIRPEGSEIRGGEAFHTGLIPFIKLMKSATKSCSQGGIRGGAMTAYYPVWHHDFEQLIVLKNNEGTEATRERHIDYGVQFNEYLLTKMLAGEDIYLFDPSLDGLYDAFFSDQEKFVELYEKYSKIDGIMKKKVSGMKILKSFFQERIKTGRIYYQMVDYSNQYSPFDTTIDPIKMSNLCCEILLPTKPFTDVNDVEGRIQLCTLSNINWGVFSSPEELRETCYYAVRYLDNILSLQDYPMIQAKLSTEEFRPLGIGVNNLAYFIAKNDTKYGDKKCLKLVDKWIQHQAYYLQEATIDLAKERGACTKSHTLKPSQGIFMLDNYKKTVDELVEHKEYLDWDVLRERAKQYGVRNATLIATPPSESNSQVVNATNGVEPVRASIIFKDSKDGSLPNIIPNFRNLQNKYDYVWDMKDMKRYIRTIAVLQKYHCQTISTNYSYNPENYKTQDGEHKIPMSLVIEDFLYACRYGVPTGYYNNTKKLDNVNNDSDEESEDVNMVETVEELEDDCESCKL